MQTITLTVPDGYTIQIVPPFESCASALGDLECTNPRRFAVIEVAHVLTQLPRETLLELIPVWDTLGSAMEVLLVEKYALARRNVQNHFVQRAENPFATPKPFAAIHYANACPFGSDFYHLVLVMADGTVVDFLNHGLTKLSQYNVHHLTGLVLLPSR